ncbi:MAG: 30S ribosomal protein S13 [Chloroflexi bacterium]|nr:30S ribosomal protein S13 [Chloroflexota bacterium]MBT9166158.1 30S ribosomal protein S13 [Chloroflexota bacterium]
MARIAGVDIPANKQIEISLRYIYGIGPTLSKRILTQTGVNSSTRVRDLSDEELNRIREVIDKQYKVEGDLRKEVTFNIKRFIEMGSYRGLRHRRGLPVHGQRTKTNARTKRGPAKTVAGRGRRRGMTKK